ncbi:MAG TPA: riboflavin synthase [Gemmatimonadales bacterium]|nr:riboflavin synthase [Gemmatimonadales bacterium]
MFTGIVTAVGRVASAESAAGGLDLVIDAPYADLTLGESVAVNGACLTVVASERGRFQVHVVRTSLERTRLGELAAGDAVNLERALRAGDRLGGHIVQGHVDGLGIVEGVRDRDDARLVDIRMPADVARVTIPLGSVTVDGVSLTVNALPEPDLVQVSLIPFTLQHTTLGARRPGDRVHLEGDTIGKYVKALAAR